MLLAALSTEAFVNVYLKCQDVVTAKRRKYKAIVSIRLTVRSKVNGFPASSNISKAAVKLVVLLLPGLWTFAVRHSRHFVGVCFSVGAHLYTYFCCKAHKIS